MVDEIRKKAIDKVNDAFNRGVSCGYIYVPTGTGKSHITESIVVDELKRDSNANVMVVFKTRMEVEQFNSIRIKHGGLATKIHNGTDRVSITTYHQAFTKQSQYNLSKYSLFILCDADRISNLTQKLFDGSLKGRVLGVFRLFLFLPAIHFLDQPPFINSKTKTLALRSIGILTNLFCQF